jgi:hypothetical protein
MDVVRSSEKIGGRSMSLHALVLSKFREAFGEPDNVVNSDSHWSLRRLSYQAAVHVLLNGAKAEPIVWVFDPHDPTDGVFHTHVRAESEIDQLIQWITQRVQNVGQ